MISIGHSLGITEIEKDHDLMGITFDPYEYKHGPFNHLKELKMLKSYQWVDTHGNIINMKRTDIRHLMNIYGWMLNTSKEGWEYQETAQFKFLTRRIKNQADKVRLAMKILSKPMGWS